VETIGDTESAVEDLQSRTVGEVKQDIFRSSSTRHENDLDVWVGTRYTRSWHSKTKLVASMQQFEAVFSLVTDG